MRRDVRPLATPLRARYGSRDRGASGVTGDGNKIRDPHPVTIGPWQIMHELGEGGMARVLLAERALGSGHSKVAVVKVPKERYLVDGRHREAFFAEADLAMKLDHPNIVPVFDAGVDEGLPYFAMMFVAGRSLSEVIRDRSLNHIEADCEVAAYVTLQVAYALQYAHEFEIGSVPQRIIHRDVSAKNVMVGGDGSVRLSDFGVATALSTKTSGHVIKGTIVYMAPEHALGHASQKSDVFGLGTILWMLLDGRRFRGDLPANELYPAVVRGYIPDVGRRDAPADLRRVLDGLLDPEERSRIPLAEAIPILEQYPSRRTALAQTMRRLYGRDARRSGRTKADHPVAKALLATKALAKTHAQFEDPADPNEDFAPPTMDVAIPAALREEDAPVVGMRGAGHVAAPSDRTERYDEADAAVRVDTTQPLLPVLLDDLGAEFDDRARRRIDTERGTVPASRPGSTEETQTSHVQPARVVSRPLPSIFVRHRLRHALRLSVFGLCCVTIGSLSVVGYLQLVGSKPSSIEDRGADPLDHASLANETGSGADPIPREPPAAAPEPLPTPKPEHDPVSPPSTDDRLSSPDTADPPPVVDAVEPTPATDAAGPVSPQREQPRSAPRKPAPKKSASVPKTVVVKLGLGFVPAAELRIDGRTHAITARDKPTLRLAAGRHTLKWRTASSSWTSTHWTLEDGCEYFALVDAKSTKLSKKACN
jgi:serine/threonine protein kinase